MRHMKKFASLLLALVMVLSLTTTVFAATITAPGEVDSDQNETAETYTAYKIFNVTKTADGNGYAYTLSKGSEWENVLLGEDQTWFDLALSADGAVYTVALNNGVANDETTAKAAAAYLLTNKPDSVTGTVLNAGENEVTDGYYLIESSLGSNLALATTDIAVDITEKNSYPSLEKTADKTTASIGDTVTYTVTVTVPKSANKDVVVHDTMSAGLTFTKIIEVKAAGANVAYNLNQDDGCTFDVTFNADAVAGKTVTIQYTAILNENAVIFDEDGSNENHAYLTYSNFTSTPVEIEVRTFEFDLVKTTSDGKVLTGAEFELYDAETDGNKINLVDEGNGVYRVATDAEAEAEGVTSAVIEAGKVEIEGLGNGTYYLQETAAPEGYNKLTTRTAVTIENANNKATVEGDTYSTGGVQVVNNSGTELPSTGGMGTTVFYVIGSILVLGAAVLLITKKRMSAEN